MHDFGSTFFLIIPSGKSWVTTHIRCTHPAVQAIPGAATRFPANKEINPRNINIVTYLAARRPPH
jgi:hypothetical protein